MSEARTSWFRGLNKLVRQELPHQVSIDPGVSSAPREPPRLRIRNYRPEVDGLRAVAILPVLFYHAHLGCPGGYVGVDVFFVISGFLITSLIHHEMEAGKFSLINFWTRRARRIVPASLMLTFAVLVAGWFLLLPRDFQALGKSAAAQALFSSNIYFWSTVSYFKAEVGILPLLHTWSLAVEEQFYVFFPLLLLCCFRSSLLRRRRVLLGLFAVMFLVSLVASEYALFRWPSATFYLLPTRAWELLAGSLLAISPAKWTTALRPLREATSLAGLLGIGYAVFCYHEVRFPGLAALPPCLGAACIIWSNGAPGKESPVSPGGLTMIGRVLASPAPVFIGLISYSLYLWHWPLFAFSNYCVRGPLTLGYRLCLIALAFLLAILSWAFVEGPFRTRRIFPSRNSVLAFAGSGLVLMLALGSVISVAKGFPKRFSTQVAALADASQERYIYRDTQIADIESDHLQHFGPPATPGEPPQLLVWGDSHAGAAMPAVELYSQRHGVPGVAVLCASVSPLLNYFTIGGFGLNEKTVPFAQAAFDYVRDHKIPRVLLISYWQRDLVLEPDKFPKALIGTITAFNAIGVKVYVLLQVPGCEVNVPRALALDAAAGATSADWRLIVGDYHDQQRTMYDIAASYHSPQCVFIDPAPAFLDADGRHYQVIRNGHPLFIDQHHLTIYGATEVLEPVLEKALDIPPRK